MIGSLIRASFDRQALAMAQTGALLVDRFLEGRRSRHSSKLLSDEMI